MRRTLESAAPWTLDQSMARRGFQGVSLEASRASHSRFQVPAPPFVKIHRKNIPEIFVYITPEKTRKNRLSKKRSSKNSFNISSGRFRSKLKPPQSPIILNLTKWKKKNRPPAASPDPPLTPPDLPLTPQSHPRIPPKSARVDPKVTPSRPRRLSSVLWSHDLTG